MFISIFSQRKAGIVSPKDTILIKFKGSHISFNGSNSKNQIIDDMLYRDLLKSFKNERGFIINQITDVTPTLATTCGKKNNLVIGDLAFLLIDKIENLPFFEISHVQCDVYNTACPYPSGYFNAIENHRVDIQHNVKTYLLTKKQKA